MFTIVIPLYNKEKYIRRAIDSVLSQDFEDFELIVVNDGSTDGSVSQIKEVSDNRLKLIDQVNKGVGSARNTGISNANSNWIALLDADDVWATNHLSELKNIINKFPLSGMVSTQHIIVNTNSINSVMTIDSQNSIIRSIDYFFETTKKAGVVWSSAVAIRKDVFKNIGGFSDEKMGEDLEYWARIALDYPVAISEKVTSYYCKGTTGATESQDYTSFTKLKSLSDASPCIRLLVSRADSNSTILKNPSVIAYINHRLLSSVKGWLYIENILAAKNRAEFAIPQYSIAFFTLYSIALTPKAILKKTINFYKNKS